MIKKFTALMALFITSIAPAFASEADLVVPSIKSISPNSYILLLIGLGISVLQRLETQFSKPAKHI